MIRLTNLADYGVVLMSAIAGRAAGNAGPASAQELARITGIPAPTVSKLLGALARGGLLVSRRGLRGGFDLARPAGEISVGDIIAAVDGPIALTNCIEDAPGECTLATLCGMRGPWQKINEAVRDALDSVSLADIAQNPVIAGAPMPDILVAQ